MRLLLSFSRKRIDLLLLLLVLAVSLLACGAPTAGTSAATLPAPSQATNVPTVGAVNATDTPLVMATPVTPAATTAPTSAPTTAPTIAPTTVAVQPTAAPAQDLTITLNDEGKTLTLNVGDRFVLALGEGFNWNVELADQSIVSRVINITPLRGSQGVYEAHKAGRTTLVATGDPACRQSTPPCMAPSRIFQVTLIVKGQGGSASVVDVGLSWIQMTSATNGWGIGWNEDQAIGGVLKTSDGGHTWKVSSPPGLSPQFAGSAFFLDATHAWVANGQAAATPDANGPTPLGVTVYRTADGGETWQAGTPFQLDGGGPGPLYFADAQHGWMMAGLGVAAGSMAVEVLNTVDGGQTWQVASLTSGEESKSTPGALPFGCLKNGLVFVDAQNGFATGHCYGGTPFFYATHDAGKTWSPITLTPPATLPQLYPNCECDVAVPKFFSAQDGMLLMSGPFNAQRVAILYVTHDGGKTWTPQLPLTVQSLVASSFIDMNTGWLADEKQIYLTRDGGQSWKTITPNIPVTARVLDFVDARNCWAVPTDVDPSGRPFLYITGNGGANWSVINPTLQP